MSASVASMPGEVQTSVYFLERSERWKTEKPYLLDYMPEPPASKTNTTVEQGEVTIQDIRGRESEFTFAKNGFAILPLESSMTAADFDSDAYIAQKYLPEVGESVKKALNASRVQIYDYTVRKREANFPTSTGEHYAHKQPASVAHIDTTPRCVKQMLAAMNPGGAADNLSKQHYQSVNVWKPVRGPLRDWPLTLCDPRSVSPKDLQARDTVKRDNFIETFQVHYVPDQKWYYISDQMPDEAWMFLQADSRPNGMLGVPHASFQDVRGLPMTLPRESIEVRCLVFYENNHREDAATRYTGSNELAA